MVKGVVFFDYDGTLVDESANISLPTSTTLKALKKLQQNGYMVALCTGRAKCHVPSAIDFRFDCYITSNGACAEINEQLIHNICFEKKDIALFESYFQKRKINYILERHTTCDCHNMEEYYFKELISFYKLPTHCFIPMHEKSFENVNKIVIQFDKREKLSDFSSVFKNYYLVPQIYQHAIDIGKKGVTKSTGIQAVLNYLNLDKKHTYAFGDSGNDIEMFQLVGTSIAMGTHTPDLAPYANYITDKVADNGIKNALLKYGLIS